jgi:hypothetical protein
MLYAIWTADSFSTIPRTTLAGTISITSSHTYNGSPQIPTFTVSGGLTEGTHFTSEIVNNVNAGTATVTLTGMGTYVGTISQTFSIAPRQLTWTAPGSVNNREYDGTNVATAATLPGLDGVVQGDDIIIVPGTLTFASSQPLPSPQAVTALGWTIGGTSTGNYLAPTGQPTFAAGTINPIPTVLPSPIVVTPPTASLTPGTALSTAVFAGSVVHDSGGGVLAGTWTWYNGSWEENGVPMTQSPTQTVNTAGNFWAVFTPDNTAYGDATAAVAVSMAIPTVTMAIGGVTADYADLNAAFDAIPPDETVVITLLEDQTLNSRVFTIPNNITIRSDGGMRTITHSGAANTSLFWSADSIDTIITLENNITLRGAAGTVYTAPLVRVTIGTFNMESGSRITDYRSANAHMYAVWIQGDGKFNMNGGEVTGNTTSDGTAAVDVIYFGGDYISLRGNARIGTLTLQSEQGTGVNAGADWSGNVETLNLYSETAMMSTVRSRWTGQTVLTGAVTPANIARLGTGTVQFMSTSEVQPLAPTHTVNASGVVEEIFGTAANPHPIGTAAQLAQIGTAAFPLNEHYRLTADIPGLGNHTPIGSSATPFTGTFNGGGFTISGMTINVGGTAGLFGVIGGGGVVENLTVRGTVSGGEQSGGIAGVNNGTIRNSANYANVSGAANTGGIAGLVGGSGRIENCYNAGNITGTNIAHGGISGGVNGGTITNNVSIGASITGSTTSSGRIVGNSNSGTLENNFARDTMLVNNANPTTGVTANGINGANATSANLTNVNWWRDRGFTADNWPESRLPLTGVLGASFNLNLDSFFLPMQSISLYGMFKRRRRHNTLIRM